MKEDSAYMHEILTNNRIGEREEMKAFDSSMNQARRSDALYHTPTILLIADRMKSDSITKQVLHPVDRIWIEELKKWGSKRPELSYGMINQSGHHIANDRPDAVLKALNTLIAKEK